ncbi:MAG TPA: hypothetical protein VFE47_31315 [Tepidisphaeraceae bacterium]|jgi:hypothetical protein|nr:hypothetical protein [Tepidisphaeraceae bacterium]
MKIGISLRWSLVGLLVIAWVAVLSNQVRADDPFAGTFSTPEGAKSAVKVHLSAAETPGAYTGTIEKGGNSYALVAHQDPADRGKLAGTFSADGSQFPVEIFVADHKLTLTSGDAKFQLIPVADPPAANAAQAVVLVPQKVVDQDMKIDAISMLVPEGWKMQGQISWIPGGAGLAVSFIAVTDPKTQATAEFYPQIGYTDGIRESQIQADMAQTGGRFRGLYERQLAEGNLDQNGAEIRHIPATPLDYVKQFVLPRLRPDMKGVDVTVVENKDLPEYAAKIAGRAPNAKAVSSRIRLNYVQQDRKMEEIFVCSLISRRIGVGQNAWSIWSAETDSYRGAVGTLDAEMPIFLAVHDSISIELPWFNIYSQIGEKLVNEQKEKLQAMIRNTAARMDAMHEYARQAQTEVSDRIRNNFQQQQATKAAAHDTFMDYVNDLQKVQNPSTGQAMKVPAGYKHAYEGTNGSVIVTNDPTAPPATPNNSWTELQSAK